MPGDTILLHMCTVNEDHRYTVPETKGATDRIFCLFTPPPPRKSKFEKLKKTLGDIIILHIGTINHNHMMYGS